MTSIRKLTDENELVKLFPIIIAGGSESGVDVAKLNPDKLWNALYTCMNTGAVFVSDNGLFAMFKTESYWSDENYLYCLLFQVRKSARGREGINLLKAAKDYAKDMGLKLYVHDEAMDLAPLFERYGFTKHSKTYCLEV